MHLKQGGIVNLSRGIDVPGEGRLARERSSVPVFDDLLEHFGLTKPPIAVAVGGVLLLLRLLAVYFDGYYIAFSRLDFWKGAIEPVAILTYVLLVHHLLNIYGRRAVQSLRPVVNLDDSTFNALVAGMSATILRYQWLAMILFAGLSVPLLETWKSWSYGLQWSTVVSTVTTLIEYAFIGSTIYLVVARNRFFTSLFKQPLNIDVFNPSPVRPMGRWGLSVAAAIMGGVTISVLLIGDAQELLSFEHFPMYLVATATAILSFFGSLSSTHGVLLRAKERELSVIRANLSAVYAELRKHSEAGRLQGIHEGIQGVLPESVAKERWVEMANAITVWLGYEKRVAEAQEWPYTGNTLRGLFATYSSQ